MSHIENVFNKLFTFTKPALHLMYIPDFNRIRYQNNYSACLSSRRNIFKHRLEYLNDITGVFIPHVSILCIKENCYGKY